MASRSGARPRGVFLLFPVKGIMLEGVCLERVEGVDAFLAQMLRVQGARDLLGGVECSLCCVERRRREELLELHGHIGGEC